MAISMAEKQNKAVNRILHLERTIISCINKYRETQEVDIESICSALGHIPNVDNSDPEVLECYCGSDLTFRDSIRNKLSAFTETEVLVEGLGDITVGQFLRKFRDIVSLSNDKKLIKCAREFRNALVLSDRDACVHSAFRGCGTESTVKGKEKESEVSTEVEDIERVPREKVLGGQ